MHQPNKSYPLVKRLKQTALISAMTLLCINSYAQQVAILDAGIDPDAGLNIAPGFNYFAASDDTSDQSDEGHGTVTARLVAQSFAGQIVPFVVTDGSTSTNSQSTIARDNALSDILGRSQVRVVAITWGRSGVTGSAAPLIPQLSNNNKVIAIMAGNEAASQPNPLATSSFNLPGVVIVGATDSSGKLLSKTNRAGTTANKYVTTSGVTSLSESEGASFATAKMAGIAGAVLLQNPSLTAQQVAEVILASAEDRGDAGVDAEYGRGFIRNAAQVLNNPVGPVVIPDQSTDSGGGGGSSSAGAALLVGGAVAGALLLLRKRSNKLEKTLVLDSYGRGFHLDLNDYVTVNDGEQSLDAFFAGLQQRAFGQQFASLSGKTQLAVYATTDEDRRLDMIDYFADPQDVALQHDDARFAIAIDSQFDNGVAYGLGYKVNPANDFGGTQHLDMHQQLGGTSFITGQSFGSLLSGFSQQANTVALGYNAPSNVRVGKSKMSIRAGLVSVDQQRQFGLDSLSTLLEGRYEFTDNAGLSMQFGQLEENKSLFGGAAGGAFGVESATTYAFNLAGHIKATNKISIVANYGIGHTEVEEAKGSFLRDFDDLKSDWYALGVIGNNLFREVDQFGMSFSQPLKIRSGGVDYSIPTARDFSGNIVSDRERVNLSNTGATEHAIEGYYRTLVGENVLGKTANKSLELGAFFSYRQNPNHVASEKDDWMLMATLRYSQ